MAFELVVELDCHNIRITRCHFADPARQLICLATVVGIVRAHMLAGAMLHHMAIGIHNA